ncbi:unnamed protein product, partial [Lampetra fluviatilis]
VAVPGSARGGRGAAQGEALTPVSPSAASADNAPLIDGYSARVFEECRRLEVRCLPSRVGRSFWTSALLCFARRRSSGSGVKFSDGDGAVVEGGPGGLACERTHAEDGNSFINEPGSATSRWQLRSTAAPTNVPRRKPPPPLAARAPRARTVFTQPRDRNPATGAAFWRNGRGWRVSIAFAVPGDTTPTHTVTPEARDMRVQRQRSPPRGAYTACCGKCCQQAPLKAATSHKALVNFARKNVPELHKCPWPSTEPLPLDGAVVGAATPGNERRFEASERRRRGHLEWHSALGLHGSAEEEAAPRPTRHLGEAKSGGEDDVASATAAARGSQRAWPQHPRHLPSREASEARGHKRRRPLLADVSVPVGTLAARSRGAAAATVVLLPRARRRGSRVSRRRALFWMSLGIGCCPVCGHHRRGLWASTSIVSGNHPSGWPALRAALGEAAEATLATSGPTVATAATQPKQSVATGGAVPAPHQHQQQQQRRRSENGSLLQARQWRARRRRARRASALCEGDSRPLLLHGRSRTSPALTVVPPRARSLVERLQPTTT